MCSKKAHNISVKRKTLRRISIDYKILVIFLLFVFLSSNIISGCQVKNPENYTTPEAASQATAEIEAPQKEIQTDKGLKPPGENTVLPSETLFKEDTNPGQVAGIEEGVIEFWAADNTEINGNIFGSGEKWVVLSHMYPTEQSTWFDFAGYLKENGFGVLTFDFRGYGNSGGKKDISKIYLDLDAAVNYLQDKGIKKIYLVGASMGGTASIITAASAETGQISGLITISAPSSFKGLETKGLPEKINCPKLFIAAKGDGNAGKTAEGFYNDSKEPRAVKILDGSSHGTFIFEDLENAEILKNLILEFLKKY